MLETLLADEETGTDGSGKVKANFGSGPDVKEGYENYDICPYNNVMFCDLNQLPLPFADNHFEGVVCQQTLEHLERNPIEVVKELHRITKPGGTVLVELPIFNPIVCHMRGYHPRYYMQPLFGRKTETLYGKNLFSKVTVKRKGKRSYKLVGWHMLRRFRSWWESFFFDSYEYSMVVKK